MTPSCRDNALSGFCCGPIYPSKVKNSKAMSQSEAKAGMWNVAWNHLSLARYGNYSNEMANAHLVRWHLICTEKLPKIVAIITHPFCKTHKIDHKALTTRHNSTHSLLFQQGLLQRYFLWRNPVICKYLGRFCWRISENKQSPAFEKTDYVNRSPTKECSMSQSLSPHFYLKSF